MNNRCHKISGYRRLHRYYNLKRIGIIIVALISFLIILLVVDEVNYSIIYPLIIWPHHHLQPSTTSSVRSLIISDPHLLGYRDNPWFILRWDHDRYLRKTFGEATRRVEPDVIIFLGDLFDELYSAPPDEVERMDRRFKHIYNTHRHKIYVSGDNDVGGEFTDVITNESIWKFYNITLAGADSDNVVSIKFLRIIKLNFYSREEDLFDLENLVDRDNTNVINMAISHGTSMVRTHRSLLFPQQMLDKLDCSLLISGHLHESLYSLYDSNQTDLTRVIETHTLFGGNGVFGRGSGVFGRGNGVFGRGLDGFGRGIDGFGRGIDGFGRGIDGGVLHINLKESIKKGLVHEIVVPAANYRLQGLASPGLGLLDIDNNGNARYSVLWLPNRLINVVVSSTSLVVFIIVFKHYKIL